eukprot:scaffold79831_cov49-Phaeocystis_antarctica.AAC.1
MSKYTLSVVLQLLSTPRYNLRPKLKDSAQAQAALVTRLTPRGAPRAVSAVLYSVAAVTTALLYRACLEHGRGRELRRLEGRLVRVRVRVKARVGLGLRQ